MAQTYKVINTSASIIDLQTHHIRAGSSVYVDELTSQILAHVIANRVVTEPAIDKANVFQITNNSNSMVLVQNRHVMPRQTIYVYGLANLDLTGDMPDISISPDPRLVKTVSTQDTSNTVEAQRNHAATTIAINQVMAELSGMVRKAQQASALDVDIGSPDRWVDASVLKQAIESKKLTGLYIGSSNLFAFLPTANATRNATAGDWSILIDDTVGSGTVQRPQYPKGIYVFDGSAYSFACRFDANVNFLTASQLINYVDETPGQISGALLHAAITSKLSNLVPLQDTEVASAGTSLAISRADHTHPFKTELKDKVPTRDSTNGLTSGSVFAALADKVNTTDKATSADVASSTPNRWVDAELLNTLLPPVLSLTREPASEATLLNGVLNLPPETLQLRLTTVSGARATLTGNVLNVPPAAAPGVSADPGQQLRLGSDNLPLYLAESKDAEPTLQSTKAVESQGVKRALDAKVDLSARASISDISSLTSNKWVDAEILGQMLHPVVTLTANPDNAGPTLVGQTLNIPPVFTGISTDRGQTLTLGSDNKPLFVPEVKDTRPSAGSKNAVTSGGLFDTLQAYVPASNKASLADLDIGASDRWVDTAILKAAISSIPSSASNLTTTVIEGVIPADNSSLTIDSGMAKNSPAMLSYSLLILCKDTWINPAYFVGNELYSASIFCTRDGQFNLSNFGSALLGRPFRIMIHWM